VWVTKEKERIVKAYYENDHLFSRVPKMNWKDVWHRWHAKKDTCCICSIQHIEMVVVDSWKGKFNKGINLTCKQCNETIIESTKQVL